MSAVRAGSAVRIHVDDLGVRLIEVVPDEDGDLSVEVCRLVGKLGPSLAALSEAVRIHTMRTQAERAGTV